MRGGQPRTYKQAVVWAALIVGTPLVVSTVLDVAFDEVSWTTVLLNFAIWLAISALVALAFSGGVEPRRNREDEDD